MQQNNLDAIKRQILIMYNQAFDSIAYDRLSEISRAVGEALKYVPAEAIPKAFQDALDIPRKTKYPNAGMILQCYKKNRTHGPVCGYYDSRGSWTIDGAYYSLGNMPHWCKSHYLEKWQVELWEKYRVGNCSDIELDKIESLKKVQFAVLHGPVQKTIEDWKEPEDYDIRDRWESEASKFTI